MYCTVAVLLNHIHAYSHLCQKMVVYLCLLRRRKLRIQKGDSHFEQHSTMNENWCSLVMSKNIDSSLHFVLLLLWLKHLCRSQWPCGLRRRSAAARLLRLWVRIPPGAWMSVVSVVCCQVEVFETSRSLVQRSPTDCGASLCVIYKPRKGGGPGPLGGLYRQKK